MLVTERKVRYDGHEELCQCLLLDHGRDEIVLLYQIPHQFRVHNISVPKGAFTLAYYYRERPYNVYNWLLPDGRPIAYYFNISRDVSFSGNCLSYRDLIVDILVDTHLNHYVLDLDELPCSLAVFEGGAVKLAIEQVIKQKQPLVHCLDERSQTYVENGCLSLWEKALSLSIDPGR